jgi:ribosomal-protein-alanine N-acetyltransferase
MNRADLAVREMTEADIPRLLEIERLSFPVPWSAGMFMLQLGLSDVTENLVVTAGGGIIGYIASWYGYEEMHILSIAVAPDERGGDAAAMLLEAAVERSVERGCLMAVLEVRVSNARAIRFYEKQGFRQVGRRRGYYSDSGEDALLFEKEIVSSERPDGDCPAGDRGKP